MLGSEAAALNHKTINHAVKNRVVIKTAATVVQEVFYGNRRFVCKRVNNDIAVVGMKRNHNNEP